MASMDNVRRARLRLSRWIDGKAARDPHFLARYADRLVFRWFGSSVSVAFVCEVIDRPDYFRLEDFMRAYGLLERAMGYAKARLVGKYTEKYLLLERVLGALERVVLGLAVERFGKREAAEARGGEGDSHYGDYYWGDEEEDEGVGGCDVIDDIGCEPEDIEE